MDQTDIGDNAMLVRNTKIVCITIAAILISAMGSCTCYNTVVERAYIQNGYTKESQPGQAQAQWVKKQ